MSEFTGLSCYTANLLAYLAAGDDTALDRFADSVRLAVRVDLPAFSHHSLPLDRLPDGTCLRHASSDDADETAAALEAELAERGRVIVVADNARLPWSPSYRTEATAPHWLLLDDRGGDGWHVVDHFAGLLPTGEQEPFDGVLSTAELLHAMDGPEVLTESQERRNALVFGHLVEPPGSGRTWLRRVASGPRFHSPGGVRHFEAGRPEGGQSAIGRPGCGQSGGGQPGAGRSEGGRPEGGWSGAGQSGDRQSGVVEPRADQGGGGERWLSTALESLPYLSGLFREDPLRAADCLDDLWTAAGHHVFRYRRANLDDAADAWRQLPGALRFAVDSARRGRPRDSLVDTTFRNLLHIESGQEALLPSAGRTAR